MSIFHIFFQVVKMIQNCLLEYAYWTLALFIPILDNKHAKVFTLIIIHPDDMANPTHLWFYKDWIVTKCITFIVKNFIRHTMSQHRLHLTTVFEWPQLYMPSLKLIMKCHYCYKSSQTVSQTWSLHEISMQRFHCQG